MDTFEIDEMVMITDLGVCGDVVGKWIPLRWMRW